MAGSTFLPVLAVVPTAATTHLAHASEGDWTLSASACGIAAEELTPVSGWGVKVATCPTCAAADAAGAAQVEELAAAHGPLPGEARPTPKTARPTVLTGVRDAEQAAASVGEVVLGGPVMGYGGEADEVWASRVGDGVTAPLLRDAAERLQALADALA